MLQGRLTRPALLAVATLALTACAGVDGTDRGAIREAVIEPGITAIEDSKALACSADAQSIMTALEIHELMDGRPAADEAELVEAGRLRAESALWDVVDGRLVPADEQCGVVPTDIGQIVTDDEVVDPAADQAAELSAITPEQFLESVPTGEIEALGGYDCALEVAEVSIAYGRYTADFGHEPVDLTELVRTGYLGDLELWFVADRGLDAVPGTPCRGPLPLGEEIGDADCDVERRTLEVAAEAYRALTGRAAPDESALIELELIRGRMLSHDVVDGEVIPVESSGCGPSPMDEIVTGIDCDEEWVRVRIALDTYEAERGDGPVTVQDLVDLGLLNAHAGLWEIVDGGLVPASGSPCELPG